MSRPKPSSHQLGMFSQQLDNTKNTSHQTTAPEMLAIDHPLGKSSLLDRFGFFVWIPGIAVTRQRLLCVTVWMGSDKANIANHLPFEGKKQQQFFQSTFKSTFWWRHVLTQSSIHAHAFRSLCECGCCGGLDCEHVRDTRAPSNDVNGWIL